jgi:hypothetical protein
MQELARKGVQCEVDSSAIRLTHEVNQKRRITRVEDPVPWQAECLHQILHLFIVAGSRINLGSNHLRKLDRSDTYTAASTVDENRLFEVSIELWAENEGDALVLSEALRC